MRVEWKEARYDVKWFMVSNQLYIGKYGARMGDRATSMRQ